MRRAIALAATGLLAGCVAGPNYRVPPHAVVNRPAATGAFAGASERAFAQAPLPDRWWHLYEDPRLDALVEEALTANNDLRVAEANLRRADAVVREAETERTLTTGVSGGAALARPEATAQSLPGTVGYQVGLTLAYPLDLAGQIRRAIEASRADAEAVLAARDNVRVTVAAGVTRAYAAACSANRTIAATRRITQIERETLTLTQRLQQGGRGTAFDVTRARTAVQQSEAQVPGLVAQRQAALFTLGALLGRAPKDYPPDVAACAAPPPIRRPIPVGDGSALFRRRPDVRAAERTLAAATARTGVATANLYPQVSLGGSLGYAGPLSTFGHGSDFALNLGPLVSWTFPNRRAVRAQIAEAGAAADAAAAQFDATSLEALRQVETALSTYARALDSERALAAARDSAAQAAGQAGKLFRFGRTDFLSVVTAQETLAAAEAALAQQQAALVDAQVDVFLALGGGWQDAPPLAPQPSSP